MYDEFPFNIEELSGSIDRAEVMSIFFPMFRKALVIDARSNGKEGPMVKITPMVSSAQERLRAIRRMRSGFPRLIDLAVVPWSRSVGSLVSSGVWDRVIDKFRYAGDETTMSVCEDALIQLKRLEKAELAAAVMGQNYHTIWSARKLL